MSLRLTLAIPSLSLGGAERVLARLANHWAEIGHKVTLLTLDRLDTDSYRLDPGVRRVALDLMSDSRSVFSAVSNNVARIRAIRRAIVAADPQIVVSFIDTMNVLTLMASRKQSWPVVVSERVDPRYHHPGRMWRTLRRWTYSRCARLVVPCRGVATCFQPAAWSDRVVVIPNAVEACPNVQPQTEREPLILGVGRLSPQKRFDCLMTAFARLSRRHSDWKLIILGEGPQRGQLEALVERLGLDGRVRFPGWVDQPNCWYDRAAVFALSSRYEAFPNALLESMSRGCAVVSTDCPSGPAEIIDHGRNGLLVPVDDESAMATSLASLMADPEQRTRFGIAATEVAEEFSPASVHAKWDALFAELTTASIQ